MPLGLALVAGGLSTLNPCGFAVLPALLTFYVGADEDDLPKAPTRLLQALLVGLLMSAGSLAAFSVVGLPLSLGARRLTDAIPWAGMAVGAAMAVAGAAVLFGKPLVLPIRHSIVPSRERRAAAMFVFGAGYAVASFGCTLPVFLALIGAAVASGGTVMTLAVFGAFALGMVVVLTALSLGAALLRAGLAARMRRLVPHVGRISGGLLVATGSYVVYYWSRARLAASGALSDDPLVRFVDTFASRVHALAASGGGRSLMLGAAVVVAVAAVVAARPSRPDTPDRRRGHPDPEREPLRIERTEPGP